MHQLEDRECQNGLKKQEPTTSCPHNTLFKYKDICSLKVNGWRKI